MTELTYLRNLDGLRGYAVLAVMAYHIDQLLFPVGWLGVPVFFVLSGFLITRILLSTKQSPNYFNTFYIRRSLRIFPVYFLSLFAVAAYTVLKHLPNADFLYYLFYMQNYRLGLDDFSSAFPYFFNHTWSLAVEEQYYLFWPFIIKFTPVKRLPLLCVLLICLSVSTRIIFLNTTDVAIIWTNLISNLDMLCAGGLLAVMMFRGYNNLLRWMNLICLCAIVMYFSGSYIFHFGNFLNSKIRTPASTEGISLLFLILIVVMTLLRYLIMNENAVTRFLCSNPVIVYIGKISYGIYVYHFILNHFIEGYFKATDGLVVNSLEIILPVLMASVSFHSFEKIFLRLKNRVRYF